MWFKNTDFILLNFLQQDLCCNFEKYEDTSNVIGESIVRR